MTRKGIGAVQWLAAIALASLFVSGQPAVAQPVSHCASRAAELRRARLLLLGTVTFYLPGQIIEVTSAKEGSVCFPLDGREGAAEVEPAVGVETKVEVDEKPDGRGHRRITVRRYLPPAAEDR
jgi:hypothetical protein